jgi:nucleoside-diphosphate-sugar epimerase
MDELAPEIVVHLASMTLPGDDPAHFEEHFHNTVKPALDMARAVPAGVRLALFFGSSIEYGNQRPPFVETQPPQCSSPYAWGKIAAFHGVTEILSMRRIPGCWARPFLTFGPGPMHSQLIPSLIRGCLAGRTVPLTDGAQTRDFVFVEDLCEMVLRILHRPEAAAGEVINLASGVPRSIRSVAELIRRLAGRGDLAFGALPYRAHEPMAFHGSTAKFEALFGPLRSTPFEAAMATTLESYRP